MKGFVPVLKFALQRGEGEEREKVRISKQSTYLSYQNIFVETSSAVRWAAVTVAARLDNWNFLSYFDVNKT